MALFKVLKTFLLFSYRKLCAKGLKLSLIATGDGPLNSIGGLGGEILAGNRAGVTLMRNNQRVSINGNRRQHSGFSCM